MASSLRKIAIIGAGQAGLQLGCGLLAKGGYEVVLVQDRTGDEISRGKPLSSQCLFGDALRTERDLGLNFWDDSCPPIDSMALSFTSTASGAPCAASWQARLDTPARSVDQRLKFPAWMKEFERRGGKLVIRDVCAVDMDCRARDFDLVIVAAGRGNITRLFERDPSRSPFTKPQRALGLAYVHGMAPREGGSAISFDVIPGVGEYVSFPALGVGGPCDIMMFEGVPGGPMDCWKDAPTPAAHLERARALLETYLPWEAERCRAVELTDDKAVIAGGFAPVVRKPIGQLPSGKAVLGMADAIVLNDPITRQGANDAAKAARIFSTRSSPMASANSTRPSCRRHSTPIGRGTISPPSGPMRCSAGGPACGRTPRRGADRSRTRAPPRQRLQRTARPVPLVRRRGRGGEISQAARGLSDDHGPAHGSCEAGRSARSASPSAIATPWAAAAVVAPLRPHARPRPAAPRLSENP